ncbi:MAG: carbohydrate kinase [Lachnospiraceae bacterium]|nr:carbohydrate kinase [Lachnospiraceae bacterium]
MKRSFDVTALGELLIDFTDSGLSKQGNPLFEANPGGAPCNVLAMLTRLGRRCAFIGKVGNDAFGRSLRDTIAREGICTDGLLTDPSVPTTLAIVHTAADGERDFSFYRDPGADVMLREDELPEAILRDTAIFHFGSLSLTHEAVRAATKKALRTARESGALISFDPNLRPPLWKRAEDAKEQIAWGLGESDIVKISDNEVEFMTGERDLEQGAALLRERYPNIRLLCVTAGPDGSFAYCGGRSAFAPAFRLGGTIETTGAGDCFCGCMLQHVLRFGMELTDRELAEMLRFANAAAYLVTTRRGALRSMPSPAEIEAVLAR